MAVHIELKKARLSPGFFFWLIGGEGVQGLVPYHEVLFSEWVMIFFSTHYVFACRDV